MTTDIHLDTPFLMNFEAEVQKRCDHMCAAHDYPEPPSPSGPTPMFPAELVKALLALIAALVLSLVVVGGIGVKALGNLEKTVASPDAEVVATLNALKDEITRVRSDIALMEAGIKQRNADRISLSQVVKWRQMIIECNNGIDLVIPPIPSIQDVQAN